MTGCILCTNSVHAEDTEEPAATTVEESQNVEVLDYDSLQNLNEDAFAVDTIYTETN